MTSSVSPLFNRRQALGGVVLVSAMAHSTAGESRTRASLAAAARDGWIYGLPLVENALAREAVRRSGAKPNTLVHARSLTTPQTQIVTTPNNDTLYSRSWLDLDSGPARLVIPAAGNRYCSVALMDMYGNNFAVLGPRTVGTGGGRFSIIGPNTRSADGREIRSPTRWVWLLARTLAGGDADLEAARDLQSRIAIEAPTVAWRAVEPITRASDPLAYFTAVQALLRENPPPATDSAFFDRISELGLGPDGRFDAKRVSPEQRTEIAAGVAAGRELLRTQRRQGPVVNGWVYPKSNLGDYGQDYVYRGQVAIGGLGALPVREAMYMRPINAEGGHAFDSARGWRLELPPDKLPPVDGFWSLSMYRITPDGQYFFFDNPIGRYAIGDRTPGVMRRADGGMDIWMVRSDPGPARRSNWLPTPMAGPFSVVFRTYLPRGPLRDGSYRLPPIRSFVS